MKRTAMFLYFLLLAASPALPDTIYVPDDYGTIQEAINYAQKADVVLVRPGTYTENITFLGKPITVKGEQGAEVTLIDGGQITSVVTFNSGEGFGSVLEGFAILNGEKGTFDFTDSRARLTVEYRGNNFALWGGGSTGSREYDWRFSESSSRQDVARDSTGYLLGGSWNPGDLIDLTVEFDRGDFDQYIFRVDPETVDRATLKLRTKLGRGWRIDLHGRHVKSDNPPELAALDTKATPYGIACSWTSADGSSSVGVDLEQYSFKTDTGLVLPGGQPDTSIYELDLSTASIFGHTRAGIFGVSGSLTYLEDDGDSWPVDAWNGRLRLTLYGASGLEYSALVQYWSYDEMVTDLDDFDVLRYGLAVNWRFE